MTNVHPKSIDSKHFGALRTNTNFSMSDQDSKTLLFTSASPGEWKSAVVANTAVVFAQEGKHVLIIDTDMRKPTVHYTFHLTGTLGLSNS